jgi:hypothetical protein
MNSHEEIAGGRFGIYLIRAAEARRIAGSIKNPENKKVWVDIAESWERMAEHVRPEIAGGGPH